MRRNAFNTPSPVLAAVGLLLVALRRTPGEIGPIHRKQLPAQSGKTEHQVVLR